MKRANLIYVLLVITTLFLGCESKNVMNYTIHEKTYTIHNEEGNPFNVKYVQISDSGNAILEKKINKTLKSSIAEWINENCEWMKKSQIEVKCQNSKYLSLCYTVEWKNPNGEEFMSTYSRIGITVNMRTGKRVYLDDLFKDTDSLKKEINNYNYGSELSTMIDVDATNEMIHCTSISELKYLEEKHNADPYAYEFTLDYIGSKPSFYLTDNQVVITRDKNEFDDIYLDFKQ